MATVITIDGTDYDLTGRRDEKIRPLELDPAGFDGIPTFTFRAYARTLQNPPYPYQGQEVSVTWDGTLVFKGDVVRVEASKSDDRRYAYVCHCLGLRKRGERIPVTDDATGADRIAFNLRPDDPAYLASRAGRTVGQCILQALEMDANSAALSAAGIGNLVPGSGASARVALSGNAVGTPTIVSGGTGYSSGSPPSVYFVGGEPTTAATGHVTISGGAVTAVVVDSAGSGYKYAPQIVISRLPAASLADIANLTIIPVFPCTITGERLLDGIETFMRALYPNHFLWVAPDGTIRIHDQAAIGTNGTKVAFSGGGGAGALAYAKVNSAGAITGIVVLDGGLGYTSAPTVTITGTGTGATATASVSGGKVTGVSGGGGTGYSEFRKLLLTHGVQPFAAPEPARDHGDCFTRLVIRGRPLVEAIEFSLSRGTLTEDFAHDGLTNTQAKANWKYADFDSTGIPPGCAVGTAVLVAGGIDTTFTITAPGSGGTNGTYSVTFTGGGGTGAAANYTISGGVLTSITRTAAGSGYTSPPTMSFPLGGITGAAATCQLQGRAVASINLAAGGYGYGSAPTVVIDPPPSGTTATATANLTGSSVSGFVLGVAGTGYVTAPRVHVQGPKVPSYDWGSCTIVDTLTIRVTSDDPTMSWASDEWDQTNSGKKGIVNVTDLVANNLIASSATRKVVANTSLSPGGTSDLTVDIALPITSYTDYSLRGTGGGGSVVWRRYKPANAALAAKMTDEPFAFPYWFADSSGLSGAQTWSNMGKVYYSSDGQTPYREANVSFDVDPDAGVIMLHLPSVKHFGTITNLTAGGGSTDGVPNDIRLVVGCYKGTLTATYPADVAGVPQYQGTAYTVDGIERTLTIQADDWQDPAQQARVGSWAAEYLKSVKDTVVEFPVAYYGVMECLLWPGSAVSVAGRAGSAFTTGLESIDLPATRTVLRWPEGGALTWVMNLSLSNRRTSYTAAPALAPPRQGYPMGLAVHGAGGEILSGGVVFDDATPRAGSPTVEGPYLNPGDFTL